MDAMVFTVFIMMYCDETSATKCDQIMAPKQAKNKIQQVLVIKIMEFKKVINGNICSQIIFNSAIYIEYVGPCSLHVGNGKTTKTKTSSSSNNYFDEPKDEDSAIFYTNHTDKAPTR